MTDALAHRGPDGDGLWFGDGVGLGHRRLAIIAPGDDGAQPMTCQHLTGVLNGEIYNYKWLRTRLQRARRSFVGGSDTEVLLQGYAQWGLNGLLERIDGMFAFAIWDARKRELVLARDRMGLKPLYWTESAGGLVFGSELRAVLAHPEVSPKLDAPALRKFLTYDYVPAPRTMVSGVHKLEAGHWLKWNGSAELGSWWELPTPQPDLTRTATARDTVWESIRAGVRSRLVSDAPIGLFLSGGLDSTAVAVAAAELGTKLPSFCVRFDEPAWDESSYAREVAEHLGLEHHEVRLGEHDLEGLIRDTLDDVDEPHADTSTIPMRVLAREAARTVKAVLGGDGGDELFFGYPTFGVHGPARLAEKLPSRLRQSVLQPLAAQLWEGADNWGLATRVRRFVTGLDYGPMARHMVWVGGTPPREHADLLEPYVFSDADPLDDVPRLMARWPGEDLAAVSRLYARLYLGEGVLQKVDRATMAYGLEARAPLLSEAVVMTAARVPTAMKWRGGGKWILRRALDGKVPRHLVERSKRGFSVPLSTWLDGPLRGVVEELLEPARLRNEGIIKAEVVERLLAEHRRGWRDHHKTIWALLVLVSWYRRWL